MRLIASMFLLVLVSGAHAQLIYGGYGGISVSIGTHQHRVGVLAGCFIGYENFQVNTQAGAYYNFHSLGIKTKTPEVVIGLGFVGAYGKLDTTIINFNSVLDNYTGFSNASGFSWQYYYDKQGTSQSTGQIMIGFNRFSIVTENDLFGGPNGIKDKYRTGAISLNYRFRDYQFGWKHIFYTGDLSNGNKVLESDYPARFGYRNNKNAVFSDRSIGISAIEVKFRLPYKQVAVATVGVDSEYIRYAFQNVLMHDAYFLPRKWIKHPNTHVPMVARDGAQYLFNENQTVKPTSLYFNIGMNQPNFY